LLLHLIDVTDADPVENYRTIQNELDAYGHDLAEKPQILALNKVDAVDLESGEMQDLIRKFKEIFAGEMFLISAVARVGLDELMGVVWEKLDNLEVVA
jgi:GTP-binding protein